MGMHSISRPPPSLFETIEVVALRQPDRLCLVEGTLGWTYENFWRDLIRFTRALDAMGVRRGQRVAVSRPSFQLQLLLLIACDNLGAVSAAFVAEGDPDAPALFQLVDWVLSEKPQTCPHGVQFRLVDAAFVLQVEQIDPHGGAPCPRVVLEPHEPARLTRTSGSSGAAKFMLLSRQAQDYWIRFGAELGGYNQDTRLMAVDQLVLNIVLTRCCACLRLGGTVLALSPASVQAIHITHLWALPIQLDQLLRALPAGYVARQPVAVGTGGGHVPAQLRQRVQQVFGSPMVSRYGTNEVGVVCDALDAQGCGWLSAGVDIRIVDANGQDVPAGQTGRIGVRTPSMTDGYLNDPAATHAAFRDGWFYSGDVGALLGPRLLQLAGRQDDMLNIGGLKLAALALQNDIRQLAQVRDCAVLAVQLPHGRVVLGVALQVPAQANGRVLVEQLGGLLGAGLSQEALVLFLADLPVMPSGKLDRGDLHRRFVALAAERGF
jgi:acyl-coenzyme A synthetase/AMP-(fatty) acid ligase